MSIKKMMLLAGMALAVVAFVAPASASAAWKVQDVNGTDVATGTEVELAGTAGFVAPSTGTKIECSVRSKLYAISATKGLSGFEIETNTCKFTNAGSCTAATDVMTNLSEHNGHKGWTTEAVENGFTITGVDIDATNSGVFCLVPKVHLTFKGAGEDITAKVDNVNAITKVTLSGKGFDDELGTTVEAFGTLNVVGANSGTYKIVSD